MTSYITLNNEQKAEMLNQAGFKSIDGLFAAIPDEIKLKRPLDLPAGMSEMELTGHMKKIAAKSINTDDYTCFLGAGAYDHYIPAAVGRIISRQEFYTAYTPYQPEISQGTLQAMFEYQTMICNLTGMEVSNASVYDGGTALAEAVAIACEATSKHSVMISCAVNPMYREVVRTYAKYKGITVEEIPYCSSTGTTDIDVLKTALADSSGDIGAVVLQNPNFFGMIENIRDLPELTRKNNVLLIISADPVSLALFKPPSEYGADIVTGEGQGLGGKLSFGGPYFGFIAVSKQLMRRIPGRISGMTTDIHGKRGFVLTLQAREQHIRRGKAVSNICTNQALNALTAAVHMTLLGRQGLKQTAELCLRKAHYAFNKLVSAGKFTPVFKGHFFKEFALKSTSDTISDINIRLFKKKMIGGFKLDRDFAELEQCWLIAVTEKRTREEIDNFVKVASE